jgi:error-prone DNA polymerase
MAYVELHACSAFNFLRGASFPEHLAEVAAELEMPALAILDRNGVYGSQRFSVAAREKGVRPIVGSELTMSDGSVLPLLVENGKGYENLCSLLTQAHLRSEKGSCAIDWNELPEFAEGLVALFGPDMRMEIWGAHACSGLVSAFCRNELSSTQTTGKPPINLSVMFSKVREGETPSPARCKRALPRTLRSTRSVSLRSLGAAISTSKFNGTLSAAKNSGTDSSAISQRSMDCRLSPRMACNTRDPAGRQVLDVFTCIREHTHLDAAGKLLTLNAERHVKSDAEMRALFRDLPEAITNTERLADRLTFSLENIGYSFPDFSVPDGHNMDSFLRTITLFGAQQRYGAISTAVKRQIAEELALIEKLGFAGYFLIVWDIVNFCREHDVMVQGRGSAANSAVCFCLGITPVDPVSNHLVFERFLSESRKGWPDIDLDLPSGDRRESVIQEIYRRYGKHGAAMTANVISYRGQKRRA